MKPVQYTVVEMDEAELEQERVVFGGLARSVRDARRRLPAYDGPGRVVTEVPAEIDAADRPARAEQIPGTSGSA